MQDELFIISGIIEDSEGYQVCVSIEPSHPILKGHFPGHPLVPGVCLLVLFRRILKNIHHPCEFVLCCDSLKFVKVLSPDLYSNFEVFVVGGSDENERITIKVKSQEKLFALFIGRFYKIIP